MRSNFRKKCGCNKSSNKSCGCNNSTSSNDLNACNQYKQAANEKCQKAECLNNKATKVAQQALAAEERAECLKQQAIEECKRANELWEEYEELAKEVICLMEQAQACLAKSAECYADLFDDVEGCNLGDFGYNPVQSNNCNSVCCSCGGNSHDCGCGGCSGGCGCNGNCGCGCC